MKRMNFKFQIANCKLQIGGGAVTVGRQAEPIASAACFLCFTFITASTCAAFTFDDIEFWVGSGANRSALVIDWVENASEPPALVWGYRWDGAATGSDMLTAIVAADPRLFAKVGGTATNPAAVYGLGYDADSDGHFGIDDGTVFDDDGFAYSGPADLAEATDPGDYYAEGWFAGFWHYGVEAPAGSNPYSGGGWTDSGAGMASQNLMDGSWDSWVFSPTFNFASFAKHPTAAPPPFPPGDFNHDELVDAADYAAWAATFGSTTELDADANRDGTVNAADFTLWRDRADVAASAALTTTANTAVPEPPTSLLTVGVLIISQFLFFKVSSL